MKPSALSGTARSIARRLYRPIGACALEVQRLIARRALAGKTIDVRELADGEAARVRSAFPNSSAPPSEADMAQHAAGKIGIVVAWAGAQPLGIGFVSWAAPRAPSLAGRWLGVPEIYRLRVASRYQSLGIGSLLVRHVEEAAAARGFDRVGLGVNSDNSRARALYVRLGYVADPTPFLDEHLENLPGSGTRRVSNESIFLVKALGSDRG